MVKDRANCVLDHLEEVWYEIEFLDSWDQILVTCDCFQSVNWLKSNGFVLSLEVNTSVKEENGVPKCIVILFVEDVDQISQEKTVPDPDEFALIVDHFIDIVTKHAFNSPENVSICLFWVNVAQKTKNSNRGINSDVWSRILKERAVQMEVSVPIFDIRCEVLKD